MDGCRQGAFSPSQTEESGNLITPASDLHHPGRLIPTMPEVVAPQWIVCHNAVRSVADGLVMCPQGAYARWARCLDCRHLEVAEDDREPERSCSTEPAATAVADATEPPEASWGALVIELL
jgi:hypothetical protein